MSDVNGDGHGRTRRRAVRSVGPPIEETTGAERTPGYVGVAEPVGPAEPTSARTRDVAGETSGDARAGARADEPRRGDAVADAALGDAVPGGAAPGIARTSDATAAGEAAAGGSADVEATGGGGDMLAKSVAAGAADSSADDTPSVEVTEAGSPGAVSADADAGSASKRSLGRILTVAAAAVLVLVMVGGAIGSLLLTRAADQREDRRTAYVQTARQAVLNLTTIRADSAKEDIDRILSLASGQFKSEFDGRVDPFMSIVQQAKVVSNGEVVEAAVQSDDADSAQVLVAAKQTLTNAGQAEPQTRYYRFRVTVTRSDSGLTASKVEFVA